MNWRSYLLGIGTILILLAVAGGAYYLGTRQTPTEPQALQPSPLPQATETPTPFLQKEVSGGGVLNFKAYTLSVPEGWIVSRESEKDDIDRLTLSKDGYEIRIMQGATGGSLCLYPGDLDVEGPSVRYTTYVVIKTQDGDVFRRSGVEKPTGYTICRMQDDGSYIQPTNFGHISYAFPDDYQVDILSEMDSIISSLKSK